MESSPVPQDGFGDNILLIVLEPQGRKGTLYRSQRKGVGYASNFVLVAMGQSSESLLKVPQSKYKCSWNL